MKLVYLIQDLAVPGGTVRVLHNKACWFSRQDGFELTIVTTDQGQAPIYFDFPKNIRIIDLGINYSEIYSKGAAMRLFRLFQKKKRHFRLLSGLLKEIRPDITITLYPTDTVCTVPIKDGSKKVVEFHNSRFLRLSRGYRGIHRWVARYRTWQDYRFVRRFDLLVALTGEGAGQWEHLPHIKVIPNAITSPPPWISPNFDAKRVIAVGRLVYEKGFDRLIKAWASLPEDIRSEWRLDIYGSGEQEVPLKSLIASLEVGTSIRINKATKRIFEEYAQSSFIVMTSYSEGLPMVLIEAMSCGLPAVCFDFPCGPKDLIEDGINGFLVENGDLRQLSLKMETLMRDRELRRFFSQNARRIKDKFSEERVMDLWVQCFNELVSSDKHPNRQ